MNESKPYESLENLLDRMEVNISRLEQGFEVNCVDLMHQMDVAQSRIERYQEEGGAGLSEKAQFDYISNRLRKNARRLLHGINRSSNLHDLREKERPSIEQWWWFLDSYVIDQQKRWVRKVLIRIGIVVAILFVLTLIYNRFLAPDPATQAKYSFLNKAEALIGKGDLTGALDAVDKALGYVPDDTDLLITKGVLLQSLGRSDDASMIYQKAEKLLNDEQTFLISRSTTFLAVGNPSSATIDAQEAIKINSKSPEATFQLARCYDVSGQTLQAYQTYQIASDLASEQGKPELNAVIRLNMANALQRIGLPETPQSIMTVTPVK
jgi:tetratricopeptide (TPR) repeat protein